MHRVSYAKVQKQGFYCVQYRSFWTTDVDKQTYGLIVNSQLCWDAHITQRICCYFYKCPGCNLTVSRNSASTHQCSENRCVTCSPFYDFSQGKKHQCFVQRPKKRARAALETDVGKRTTVDDDNGKFASKKPKRSTLFNSVSSSDAFFSRQEEEAEQAVADEQTWVFDIETDQSCE